MHHFEKNVTLVVTTPIKKGKFSRLRLRPDSLVRAQRSIDHVYFRIEVRENLLSDAEAEVGDGGASSAEREPPGRAGHRGPSTHFGKNAFSACSFSAVSAPIFARKYALCSIFQNLPDSQAEIFEI